MAPQIKKFNEVQPPNISVLAKEIAQKSRISALEMTSTAKTSHIGACLSVIDILSTLFTLKKNSAEHAKDNVILSKGHAAAVSLIKLNGATVAF
jgi:transketolase N-terminal domain/subunit